MDKTRNKRRAKKFRKSRELQLKKKATRRQLKGGSFPTEQEFETVSKQVTTINKTMAVIIQNSYPYLNGPIDEDDIRLVERVLRDDYPRPPPAYSAPLLPPSSSSPPVLLDNPPSKNKMDPDQDEQLPYTPPAPPAPVKGGDAGNLQAAHF